MEPPMGERPMICNRIDKFGIILVDPKNEIFVPLNFKKCDDYQVTPSFVGLTCKGYILDSASKNAAVTPYWCHQLFTSTRAKKLADYPAVHEAIQPNLAAVKDPNSELPFVPPSPFHASEPEEEEDEQKEDEAELPDVGDAGQDDQDPDPTSQKEGEVEQPPNPEAGLGRGRWRNRFGRLFNISFGSRPSPKLILIS